MVMITHENIWPNEKLRSTSWWRLIFEQYEEYDGATLERVWQSLFKVYNRNHKLRKLGDNDFSVEHTGDSARQGARTLDMVLKYDQKALTNAWDYLAKSLNEEDD